MKLRIVVVYDGINNPVFESQVVAPLAHYLDKHPDRHGIIFSFERKRISRDRLESLAVHPNLTIKTISQLPFFGCISLRYAARQLHKQMLPLLQEHIVRSVVARGPFAGYIVGISSWQQEVPSIIVQARGLAAEEYRFAHNKSRWPLSIMHRMRTRQIHSIEQWVYGEYVRKSHAVIHSVSDALSDYITTTYNAPFYKIVLEKNDIPKPIDPVLITTWRTTIRRQLGITDDAYVYVYNGSAKPWQCPDESVTFFMEQYHQQKNCFLLVLTKDIEVFKQIIGKHQVPSHAVHIMSVAHQDMYRYLAAADAGLLFRQAHVINWVSRPTKALEYNAVGLKIVHNNTVGMIPHIELLNIDSNKTVRILRQAQDERREF